MTWVLDLRLRGDDLRFHSSGSVCLQSDGNATWPQLAALHGANLRFSKLTLMGLDSPND